MNESRFFVDPESAVLNQIYEFPRHKTEAHSPSKLEANCTAWLDNENKSTLSKVIQLTLYTASATKPEKQYK